MGLLLSLSLSLSRTRSALAPSVKAAWSSRQRRAPVLASRSGFTIVELLIVVVVIAILAAITIVSYNGITNQAKASAVQSLTSQAAKKILAWSVQNNETFPVDKPTFLSVTGLTDPDGSTYQYNANTVAVPYSYCLTVTQNSLNYYISNITNTTPTKGACPTVTNMVANPSFEVDVTGWYATTSGVALSLDGSWAVSQTHSLHIVASSATNDTAAQLGSYDNLTFNVQPNTTYTLSAYGKVITPGIGTTTNNGARQAEFWVHQSGVGYLTYKGNQIDNTAGATGRSSVTFTTPASLDMGFVRLYMGYATGTIDWDAVMLTTGSTVYSYADGNSNGWAWTGTANSSSSTGPQL